MIKFGKYFLTMLIGLLLSAHAFPQQSATETYVATTPCSSGTRPLPGMSKTDSIETIKWELKLSPAPGSEAGTYLLNCDYGLARQGTMLIVGGGKHIHREGKYVVIKTNKGDVGTTVYKLDPDLPAESVSFFRLSEHLLHLLDSQQRLMIGTGAWSYTLNKINK